MRHLIGFILALAVSAALVFGASWGVTWIIAHATGTTSGHPLTSIHGLVAVGSLAGTGLLIGILLVAPRASALATGLPGLILLGWSALWLMNSKYTLKYLPLASSSQAAGLKYLLLHGILAMVGAAMIIPIFAPSRWRKREVYVEDRLPEDVDVHSELGLVP